MSKPPSPQPRFFRPFLFVLQEGKEIKKDLMDFRLVLLDLRCRETVPSPRTPAVASEKEAPSLKAQQLISEIENIARNMEQTQGSAPSEPASDTPSKSE